MDNSQQNWSRRRGQHRGRESSLHEVVEVNARPHIWTVLPGPVGLNPGFFLQSGGELYKVKMLGLIARRYDLLHFGWGPGNDF